jgi:GNAT superfamily N-acetyltransferase
VYLLSHRGQWGICRRRSIGEQGRGIEFIVNLRLLPEYQGKGIGEAVLEQVKKRSVKLKKGNAQQAGLQQIHAGRRESYICENAL